MHKTFKNGLKKRRKIAQSSFCFCQLIIIDDYERLLSLLSDAFAAFPSTPNKLWVRNTSYFCQNCFGTSFKAETAYDGWKMIDLQRKRNPPIGPEKAVKIPENQAALFLI